MALPSLVLITAIVLWGVRVVSVQLACTDAARSGARAAARGESLTAVRDLVVKAVPEGAIVRVDRDEATVRVDITASVATASAIGLPAFVVHAHTAAEAEPGVPPTTDP